MFKFKFKFNFPKPNSNSYKILLGVCSVVVAVFAVYLYVHAGNIDSPGAPTSTGRMYTLQNIYDFLTSTNGKYSAAEAKNGSFNAPGSAPVTSATPTLDQIFAKITRFPATGQTVSQQTNDDGTYQSGSLLSYTDNTNGTITDNNTKLMWIKQPELVIPGAAIPAINNQIPNTDSHGDLVTKGDWVTSPTIYYVRDLVRAPLYTFAGNRTLKVLTATTSVFSAADVGREILNSGTSVGTITAYVSPTVVWTTASGTISGSPTLTVDSLFYCTTQHTAGTFLTDLNTNHYWREALQWATGTPYSAGDVAFARQRDVGINATQATTIVTAASGTPFTTADIGRNLFIGTTNCGYITGIGTTGAGTSPNVAVTVSINQTVSPAADVTIYSTYVASTAHTSSGAFIYTNDSANWRETLWINPAVNLTTLLSTTTAATLATPKTMRWDNGAIINCQDLATRGYAGYNDWRLPNLKELVSIANYGTSSPAISTAYFPNTQSNFYWTSTTYASNPTSAWYVSFSDGGTGGNSKPGAFYVRCVRGQ